MGSNTVKVCVGRLLEIRADAGYRSPAEVDELFDALEKEVSSKIPTGVQHVTVVDWRRCPIMSPDAAQRIGQRIAGRNSRTERSAALASADAPVAVLQFLRLIRDAKLADRKLFFSESELVDWLDEVLSPAESTRLRKFLKDGHE